MGVLDTGGGYECVNAGGIWKVSVPSSGLSCELKMSLKKKSLNKLVVSYKEGHEPKLFYVNQHGKRHKASE